MIFKSITDLISFDRNIFIIAKVSIKTSVTKLQHKMHHGKETNLKYVQVIQFDDKCPQEYNGPIAATIFISTSNTVSPPCGTCACHTIIRPFFQRVYKYEIGCYNII